MHVHFKIITCCLLKNLLVPAALLWILGEARHLLGIGTRLVSNSDGGLSHVYTTGVRSTGGYSDSEHDYFGPEKPTVPKIVWIVIILILFLVIVLCFYFFELCQTRRRRLWGNVNANPSFPRPDTSPPVPQENVRTPVRVNDVPPDYTVVVDEKTMQANGNDGLNDYPEVVGGMRLETPPPDYMTVAPFK